MANISKTLPGSDIFQSFSHTLFDWVGVEIFNLDKEETLIGFEIISNPIQEQDGDVQLVPNEDETLIFKGIFEDQSEFEAAHSPQVNGISYYDKELDIGRKYLDGVYQEIDYVNVDFSSTYSGTYGAGVFPNTTIKWKDICTEEKFEQKGWPPPDDPMTQFIYEINIDTGTFKSRDVQIRYDVRIEDTSDPTAEIEYRSDIYTYKKSIQNAMGTKVSTALKDHFAQFGRMDYTTCELLPDEPLVPIVAAPIEEPSIEKEIKSGIKLAFPDSTVAGNYKSLRTRIQRLYQSNDKSGSEWSVKYNETAVMDGVISSTSERNPSNNWKLRIGKGGQIYSLKTDALGETVPPQYRNNDSAPWVDEVWQTVSVYNTGANVKFNHSAGVYLNDPILTEPFYTPRLATEIDELNKSFYSMNWMQPSGNLYDEDNPSHIINLTKYKDLGDGVIEITLGMYNFGNTEVYRYHNMPWGGVRRTALEYNYLSNTDQTSYTQVTGYFGEVGNGTARLEDIDDTGGWTVFCSENSGDYGESLGFVFGKDDRINSDTYGSSRIRQGYAWPLLPQEGETNWRNYMVSTLNRRHNINHHKGIWSRFYFVFGSNRENVRQKILNKNLVDNTAFEEMNITEDDVDVIGYQISTHEGKFAIVRGESPVFYLYSAPVNGSIPIFEMVKADGERFVTHNPYTIGTYKMYDKSIVSEINMLGFAMRTEDTELSLDTIFSQHRENYVADGELLSGINGITI